MKHLVKNFLFTPVIVANFAGDQVQGEDRRICEQVGCHIRKLEKRMSCSKRSEKDLNIFNKAVLNDLEDYNVPLVLWCFVLSVNQKYLMLQPWQLPPERSYPTNLNYWPSNGCIIHLWVVWYQWCYYCVPYAKAPSPVERLGRVLGPAEHSRTAIY